MNLPLPCSQHHKGQLSTDQDFHCILSQESQTLPMYLTTGCYFCCPRLLLASLPPHFSLSPFVANTGQGRGQQQSWSGQTRRSITLTLCRRQARELASPYHLSQQFFTFPPHLLQKSYTFFSTKVTGMKTARFIRVNMSEW